MCRVSDIDPSAGHTNAKAVNMYNRTQTILYYELASTIWIRFTMPKKFEVFLKNIYNYTKLILALLALLALGSCSDSGSSAVSQGTSIDNGVGADGMGSNDGIAELDTTDFAGRWAGVLYQTFDSEDGLYNASLNYELELQGAGENYTGISRITSLDGKESIVSFSVTASFDRGMLTLVEQTVQNDLNSPFVTNRSVQCLSRLDLTISGDRLVGSRDASRCPFGSIYLSRMSAIEVPERTWYRSLPGCPCQLTDVVLGITADDLLGNPGTWVELPNLPSEVEGIPVPNPPTLPQLGD